MTQTAVEWFAEIVFKMGYVSSNILEQAKEMEKQQIIRAFIDGEENVWDRKEDGHEFVFDSHEQYYNETYNKQ